LGLDFFGIKMRSMVEEVEKLCNRIQPNDKKILVHCWRGGMRSAAVAWLLNLYGYDVYVLEGGYKAFRNWVLLQFDYPYQIKVLGGYTGSAKTETIHELESLGENIIDLEGIANHKGSAFGGIGQMPQPSQEMFENILALEISEKVSQQKMQAFWIEDESQRIGNLIIPNAFWKNIRNAPLFFIDIPFEERLHFILSSYGNLDIEALKEATIRIQKRFGPNETKITLAFLDEKNIKAAFDILLNYYDKQYITALYKRENVEHLIQKITLTEINPKSNAEMVLSSQKK
jgi:tRNA 2-selenouridine synthase